MAKVLERSRDLYDEDQLAWLEQQAAHLRAGQLDRLDVAHLIEELEEMGGSQRRELKSRLEVLLLHMLKCDAQPAPAHTQLAIDHRRAARPDRGSVGAESEPPQRP